MTLPDKIRDRLELVNGKVYWKKCALYAWCPCKIRAGKENHWGDRIIKIDGEAYEEFKIIHYLTTRET
jgi:hypothetical protein